MHLQNYTNDPIFKAALSYGIYRQQLHHKRHPDRYKARYTVNNAIQIGALERSTICEIDPEGVTCKGMIQVAHYDYKNPWNFRWLCKSHHIQWDTERRRNGTM